MIGKNLLHYRIVAKLGVGGQGEVYEAVNTKLDRIVVIKVLPPNLTTSEVNLKRFEREARLASALDHPNICAIYDLAFADDVHFIIMQRVEGWNVRELVNGRPLELKSALSIGVQVCEALIAAHERGIIHRDIKANNVMVTQSGQVKVLDFGLAKLLDEELTKAGDTESEHLTEVGVPYGTATYAAPEQAQGLKVDTRADVFSTGVLLYEMLTGTWPFRGKTTIDVRYAVLHDTPQPLDAARPKPTPPQLQKILDRAMAKEPGERYQTITELRNDLRGVLHDISVADDPQFREPVTPIAPRHMAHKNPLARGLAHLSTFTGLSRGKIAASGVTLLVVLLIPLGLWLIARSRSVGAISGEGVLLRLHGSNTIGAKLAPALAEEFLKQLGARDVRTVTGRNPEEATVVGTLPGNSSPSTIEIRSHGSATAFADLLANQSDIGLSSRKINADEIQKLSAFGDMTSPGSEHILALDGIAVIVNRDNPIDSLTKEQIAQIFSGSINDWGQLQGSKGPINVYARDNESGTFDSFKSMVLGSHELVASVVRFEDSGALSDAVARDPNGIGFIGLPYVRDAKAIAVSELGAPPLLPNRLTVATEDYLLSRRLFLYSLPNNRNPWIAKFVDFALSNVGQEAVERDGFVAQTIKSESGSITQNAPEEYRKLTTGAERLSLNFRFRRGGRDLDNKARLDLDRVVSFITDLKYTGQNILLVGFADDDSDGARDLELSRERAALVAQQFKRRGLSPAVVTGFGSQIPVASAATDEGRERNRRVELWLKR